MLGTNVPTCMGRYQRKVGILRRGVVVVAYVITEACIGTKNTACVGACPVDCIYDGGGPLPDKSRGMHRLLHVPARVPGGGHLPWRRGPRASAAIRHQGRRV